MTKRFTISLLERKKLAGQVFELLRQNTWMPTQTLISTDISLSNAGNFMTTLRLLISFLFADGAKRGTNSDNLDSGSGGGYSEDDQLRSSLLAHLKSESLLRILSQVVHQSSRKELVALAYELLFDLASLSKTENLNFSFET